MYETRKYLPYLINNSIIRVRWDFRYTQHLFIGRLLQVLIFPLLIKVSKYPIFAKPTIILQLPMLSNLSILNLYRKFIKAIAEANFNAKGLYFWVREMTMNTYNTIKEKILPRGRLIMGSLIITIMMITAGCTEVLSVADENLVDEESLLADTSVSGVSAEEADAGTETDVESDDAITKSAAAALLTNITILSDTKTVLPGGTVNMTLLATYSNGSTKYVTSKATWSVTNKIGYFSSAGVYICPDTVTSKTAITIKAAYSENRIAQQTSTTLTVTLPDAPVIAQGDYATFTVDPADPTAGVNELTLSATSNATPLTWSIASDSTLTNGQASFVGETSGNSAVVTYAPSSDTFMGLDSFAVLVTDKYGSTDRIEVKVEVVRDSVYARDFAGGFNTTDVTDCLQTAINSGAKRVVVTNEGSPWITGPITLVSNQEVYFEDGTVVQAIKNDANGKPFTTTTPLFMAKDKDTISLIGYNATLKMNKSEYTDGQWRHVISLSGCSNVVIKGLTCRDSGGDGIYLGAGYAAGSPCKNITIVDTTCDNNKRNGFAVISAQNVLVDRCSFTNSSGASPATGIDIEPNPGASYPQLLDNITIQNTAIQNNKLNGLSINLNGLTNSTTSVNMNFNNLTLSNNPGIQIVHIYDTTVDGTIKFQNITIQNAATGIRIFDKSASNVSIQFQDCTLSNIGTTESYPITFLQTAGKVFSEGWGGIEIQNCKVYDNYSRAAIGSPSWSTQAVKKLNTVQGTVYVNNPYGISSDFKNTTETNVDVQLIPLTN
jgi:hypothetical protein